MSDLRDKLAALGHRASPAHKEHKETAETETVPADLGELLGAREQGSPAGPVLIRTTRFPLGEPWGASALAMPRFGAVLSGYVGGGLASVRDPGRTVFLDTETTGLAGGSGTYAFLVGIGRFAGDAFVLRQFFLRGPWEERAMLAAASLLLEGAAAVVSYNGKSFDVPLLQSRLAYHGLPDPLQRTPHVDLLHISRRLWRERLTACTLGDVERGALAMARSGADVPGHLIPELYFSFLRSGEAAPLRGVMHHNELDICSLAALLVHVDNVLEGRFDPAAMAAEDVVSLARTWESFGLAEEALALLDALLRRPGGLADGSVELACDACLMAGRLAKRLTRFAAAARFWERAVERAVERTSAGDRRMEAMIELAKLSEHQDRDPEAALAWVERASKAADVALDAWQRERLVSDLAYRRERLLRKLSASQARSRASRQASSS